MVEYLPSFAKARFYYSFFYWYHHDGSKDFKMAIEKATVETRISLQDAHDLFLEINGRTTDGLADTRNRTIVDYFKVNWDKLAKASEKLLQAA